MPSTKTIAQTLAWVGAYIVQRPTSGVISATEPGLTAANKIFGTIGAPPFRWNWNRKELQNAFVTLPGVTDYTLALSDFGYLEKATSFIAADDPPMREIEVVQNLAQESKQNPPQKICAFIDDGAGNITFRVLPNPDRAYQMTIIYQKAMPVVTSLGALWSPIPDKYSFLYETGMMAHMQGMYNAQLYALNMEIFFRQLLGAAEGISESERAIFLDDRLRDLRAQTVGLTGAQQGRQVRV